MANGHAARRAASAARSGSGPTGESAQPGGRWPGASQKFALFGEVLQVGIIVTVLSLPLITIPLALAIGQRHLQRFLRAETSSLSMVWTDVRNALPGGLLLGVGWLAATVALLLDAVLVPAGNVPGGAAFAGIGALGVVLSSVALMRVTGCWTPESGWRGALHDFGRAAFCDLSGSMFLAIAVALTVLCTWMLAPLLVPATGCLCFASVVIASRQRLRGAAPRQ